MNVVEESKEPCYEFPITLTLSEKWKILSIFVKFRKFKTSLTKIAQCVTRSQGEVMFDGPLLRRFLNNSV